MKLRALLLYTLFLTLGTVAIWQFPKAQSPDLAAFTPEEKTALYLENARTDSPRLLAFLREMPKGGDLHSHLSGTVYAESFVRWAAARKLCLDEKTLVLYKSTDRKVKARQPATNSSISSGECALGQLPLKQDLAANDPVLYRRMIEAWSMRNWEHSGRSGHDQFFDSFRKFAEVADRTGEMVAEAMRQAEDNQVTYLELMLSLDGGQAEIIGNAVGWNGDYGGTIDKLRKHELYKPTVEAGRQWVYDSDSNARAILKCNESESNPGCKTKVPLYLPSIAR